LEEMSNKLNTIFRYTSYYYWFRNRVEDYTRSLLSN
jgi:hypothetical protein